MGLDLTKVASNIWRAFSTDGVATSGAHWPPKADIRTWAGEVEAALATTPASLGSVGGTANAITATSSPSISAPATGQPFFIIPTANNTGAVTINRDSAGNVAVVDKDGDALVADALVADRLHMLVFDGTSYRVMI